jgi:SAM-dependent methyltransferase
MLKTLFKPIKTKKIDAPFDGYTEHRYATPYVDCLSDADLQELNRSLNWNCFTVDSHGRRFGAPAWAGKRSEAQIIPDPSMLSMYQQFNFTGKTVTEVGCFEGIHTIGLFQQGAKHVIAVDSRIENVLKTTVRCAMFGHHPTVFKCNLEERPLPYAMLEADILHHVGVLYHLDDPVRHLLEMGQYIREGIILNSHYATPEMAKAAYDVDGQSYRYYLYEEFGYKDPFSGMYPTSKWLLLEDIETLLKQAGFNQVKVIDTFEGRNGPRFSLIAKR